MSSRLAVVLFVATLCIGVRGQCAFLRYFSVELSSAPPFSAEPRGAALVLTSVNDSAACYAGWAGPARPRPGDSVLGIWDSHGRGGEIRGLFDYGAYLRPVNAEEPWTLVVGRQAPSGLQRIPLNMPPATRLHWDATEWLARLAVDLYLPLLAIAAGVLIGCFRPRDGHAYLASLLFLALSLTIGLDVTQFPPYWRDVALSARVAAFHVLPFLVFVFFVRFPAPSPIVARLTWLAPLFLSVTSASVVVGLAEAFAVHYSLDAANRLDLWLASIGTPPGRLDVAWTAAAAAMILVALVSVVLNAARARSADERRRLRIIAAGAVAGLAPAAVLLVLSASGRKTPLGVLLVAIPLIGLFPISFGYAVVRHRVFGIRLILRKGLRYALVSRGFLGAEAALAVAALWLAVEPIVKWAQPAPSVVLASGGTLLAVAGVALGARRLNRLVLPIIDRRFFRETYDARRILTDLGRAVRRMASRPEQLLERVTGEIGAALHPSRLAIFLAPSACPRLVPLDGPMAACWRRSEDAGSDCQFLLYVDERPAAEPDGQPLPRRRPCTAVSLARYLASAADGDAEALEVEPFPAAGPARPRRREDEAVLTRFGARLVVPIVTAGRALGFILLGEKRSEEPYSSEDKDLLLTVSGQMAIALDYAQLISQAADQAALKRELQIARDVQLQLFPHERPVLRTLRYGGVCRAARGVGGDFYDYLPLTRTRLGLAVADIAGKGLPAALLMARLQALLRSHAPTYASALGDLGRELNRHLCETSDGARFATLFFGVYDDEERSLTYLNAGHVAPIVLAPGGDGDSGPSVRRLDAGGMVLGLFGDQTYADGCVALSPGERLVVFSDGVTEATNAAGEMFGDERLVAAVVRGAALDVETLASRVVEEVDSFVGSVATQDDVTVIAAEVVHADRRPRMIPA